MNPLVERYSVWLTDYYLLSSALLALAFVGIAILHQPAQRLAVVKSSFVSLALLAVLSAVPSWSLLHLRTPKPETPAPPSQQNASGGFTLTPPAELNQTAPAAIARLTISTATVSEPSPPEPATALPRLSWSAASVIAHVTGAVAIGLWLVLGWFASTRLRRTARPAPTVIRALLDELSPANSRPRLFTHERLDVAVAFGVWRSIILLPASWIRHQTLEQLRTVLAHESAHIRNRDLEWIAASRVLLLALWANPLFWMLRRQMRLDQEALADAAAAELTSRESYAEQLVTWARAVGSQPSVRLSSAVGLWEGPSQLRQRIAILLNERFIVLRNCSRRWRFAATMTLIAGATGLSLITIQPGKTRAAAKTTDDKPATTAASPKTGTLTMRFEYDGTPPAPRELQPQPRRVHTPQGDRTIGPPRESDVRLFAKNKIVDESLVVGKDRGIANVFVWVRSKNIPFPKPAALPAVMIAFRDGHIEPHAIAFQAPRRLVLRNDEDVACNFNLTQLGYNPLIEPHKEYSLDVRPQTLPVRVDGNAQTWLKAYLLPMASPYVAVSDEHGVASINDLPPGKWEFQVWHERPGYVKTADWHMGRFTLEIKPGDNDLGTIKLPPGLFNEKSDDLSAPQPTPPATATPANHDTTAIPDATRIVGTIYGKKVTAADIGFTEPIDTTVHFNATDKPRWDLMKRISQVFGKPVNDRFVQQQKIDATPDEIDQFVNHWVDLNKASVNRDEERLQQVKSKLVSEPLAIDELAKLETEQQMLEHRLEANRKAVEPNLANLKAAEEMARKFIIPWKTERDLHRKYGGRVIFQQFGPEALDARRKLYEQAEKTGDLVFNDPGVRYIFYYYSTEMHHTVIDDKVLEKPWFFADPQSNTNRDKVDTNSAASTQSKSGVHHRTQDASVLLVQNTKPISDEPAVKRPANIIGYGDDKPDGKKSIGGSGEMIRFELPEGVTKIKGLRIHGSRYGYPQAPKEDFEITFLNEKRDETLHSEDAPYRLFNRGKEQWVRVMFKNEIELPKKFWLCLNFNAEQTKGVYVSYDTSTKGEYSRVGLPGDKEEPKETDFHGDWMIQLILPLKK